MISVKQQHRWGAVMGMGKRTQMAILLSEMKYIEVLPSSAIAYSSIEIKLDGKISNNA